MKDYERMRAEISKQFKNEIQQLKLEIIKLQNENANLVIENVKLKNKIRECEDQLNSISDSRKRLFRLTETIKFLP